MVSLSSPPALRFLGSLAASMASESTAFATDAPPSTAPASALPNDIPSQDEAVRDAVRLLKRPRSPSPASPRSLAAQSQSQHLLSLRSPHKSARLILEGAGYPHPLTGAAALEDERQRREEEERAQQQPVAISENPGQRALAALMSGATQAMSRPADAPQPAPTAAMEPVAKVPNTTTIAINSVGHDDNGETSPQSVAGVHVTESPTPMDVDGKVDHPISSQQVVGQEEKPQPGSLSYPGSLQSTASLSETPTRGMSFPMPSPGQTSPTSSGAKKHKCPYCNTEFTRHHNLKSHLLTHSQEKPYVCTECQMRFRRLHDLKRHGKLHTGERPHVCPKCDRGFARGDALARHSKGAGGCAGRRSSMTSFADGDELDGSMVDPDDSTMSGLAYENPGEDELRRQSLPSINAHHVAGSQSDAYGAHSRTYPPVGSRGGSGGLYPPNVNQNQAGSNVPPPNVAPSGHTPNTSISSVPVSGSTSSMYSQAGITESPKPLSPGVPAHEATNIARQRSPSLSQQLQQQQFGRRQSELQSPHSGQPRPKLPGLSHPGFAPPNSTGFSHTRTGSGAQATTDSGNMFAQSDPSVWAYIQTLEERVKSLSEKVATLDQEMAVLKQQNENRDTLVKT